jgi:hypothetical protein
MKTQRYRAILLRTRFTTLWRSEIHINLKIVTDALNRRRRRFMSAVQYIISIEDSEGSMLVSAHTSTIHPV